MASGRTAQTATCWVVLTDSSTLPASGIAGTSTKSATVIAAAAVRFWKPAVVAPGHNHVVPLEPEFIAPQDGAEKQDCESRAARRWLAGHGAHYARLNPVYLG